MPQFLKFSPQRFDAVRLLWALSQDNEGAGTQINAAFSSKW